MRIQNIIGMMGHMPGVIKGKNPHIPGNNCNLPPNPFPDINASNPTSWYSGVSNFISGLMGSEACVESSITDGILTGNPSFNPQAAIHKKFQIAALLARAYDLLKEIIEKQKEFLKQLKDTSGLALAAK